MRSLRFSIISACFLFFNLGWAQTTKEHIVYYAPNLPAEHVQTISSEFDLMVMSFNHKNQLAQIKSKRPDFKAYGYQYLRGLEPSGPYFSTAEQNESWFLHDSQGHRLINDYWGWYLVDVTNPSWRSFIVQKTAERLADYNQLDGIFSDDTTLSLQKNGWHTLIKNEQTLVQNGNTIQTTWPIFIQASSGVDIKVLTSANGTGTNYFAGGTYVLGGKTITLGTALPQGTVVYVTYRGKDNSVIFAPQEKIDTWASGMLQILQDIRQSLQGRKIIANVGLAHEFFPYVDGIMNEHFANFLGFSYWRNSVEHLATAMDLGKIFLANQNTVANPSVTGKKLFVFCSYLLGMGNTSYFYFHEDNSYNTISHDSLWNIDLGQPLGDFSVLTAEDPNALSRDNTNLLANSSFEENILPWRSTLGNTAPIVSLDTAQVRTGASSLKLQTQSDGHLGGTYQAVDVKPQTTYTATVWTKMSGFSRVTPPSLTIAVDDATGRIASVSEHFFRHNDAWNPITLVFRTQSLNAKATLYAASIPDDKAGTLWLDDIELTEGIPVFYRNFEKGRVFVNSTAYAARIRLEKPMSTPDGNIVTVTVLPPQEGVILFNDSAHTTNPADAGIDIPPFKNYFTPGKDRDIDIVFTTPGSADTRVSVYNRLGEKMTSLAPVFVSGNTQRVIWNGRDDNGKKMSAGLYLIIFETGSTRVVKKVVVLK